MDFVKIFVISLLAVAFLLVLIFSALSKRFFKTLLINAVLGLLALATLKVCEGISGIYIPINQYTVSVCSFMGLPSVIGILILRFIFI